MNRKSLSNPNLFKVVDEITHKTHFGYHQECYATEWQRLSGCGPSTATNILSYLNHTNSTLAVEQIFNNNGNCLPPMEEIWGYVTPTKEGIPNTKIFYENVLSYALGHNNFPGVCRGWKKCIYKYFR